MPESTQYRQAKMADIETIATLEKRFNQDELSAKERTRGFEGQGFSVSELNPLVSAGLVWVAEISGEIMGYLILGDWNKLNHSPLCQALYQRLSQGHCALKTDWRNTLHYGPVWVHPKYRGKGVFDGLYSAAREHNDAPWLALIAEDNEASLRAHSRHARMQTLDFVTLCGRDFYLLQG